MYFLEWQNDGQMNIALLRTNFFPPRVNCINILQAAFTRADPKSAKKTVKPSSFFVLLGSAWVKVAGRTLMKLTPSLESTIPKFHSYKPKLSQIVMPRLHSKNEINIVLQEQD